MSGNAGGSLKDRAVTIINEHGLHQRAAKEFVKVARAFQSQITVAKGRQIVDAKDIWDVMTLAAERGTVLTLRAQGADARAALDALEALVAARFYEEA